MQRLECQAFIVIFLQILFSAFKTLLSLGLHKPLPVGSIKPGKKNLVFYSYQRLNSLRFSAISAEGKRPGHGKKGDSSPENLR
jgi:hypothetical protein